MSELLTRAMRTDDSELLFSDSFNDYGSMKPILFLLSFSCFFKPSRQTSGGAKKKKKLFNVLKISLAKVEV